MLAEDRVVMHSNDVVFVIFVFLFEISEQIQLHARLVLEALFISNDLDSYDLL